MNFQPGNFHKLPRGKKAEEPEADARSANASQRVPPPASLKPEKQAPENAPTPEERAIQERIDAKPAVAAPDQEPQEKRKKKNKNKAATAQASEAQALPANVSAPAPAQPATVNTHSRCCSAAGSRFT